MKCVHCSASVEKRDWFCPNCKRSMRPLQARRARRGGAAPLFAATALLSLALGAAAGMRFQPERSAEPTFPAIEAPLVQITTLTPEDTTASAGTLLVGYSR